MIMMSIAKSLAYFNDLPRLCESLVRAGNLSDDLYLDEYLEGGQSCAALTEERRAYAWLMFEILCLVFLLILSIANSFVHVNDLSRVFESLLRAGNLSDDLHLDEYLEGGQSMCGHSQRKEVRPMIAEIVKCMPIYKLR